MDIVDFILKESASSVANETLAVLLEETSFLLVIDFLDGEEGIREGKSDEGEVFWVVEDSNAAVEDFVKGCGLGIPVKDFESISGDGVV